MVTVPVGTRSGKHLSAHVYLVTQPVAGPGSHDLRRFRTHRVPKQRSALLFPTQRVPKKGSAPLVPTQWVPKQRSALFVPTQRVHKQRSALFVSTQRVHKERSALMVLTQRVPKHRSALLVLTQWVPKQRSALLVMTQWVPKQRFTLIEDETFCLAKATGLHQMHNLASGEKCTSNFCSDLFLSQQRSSVRCNWWKGTYFCWTFGLAKAT